MAKYKRVLIKLSGEALGDNGRLFDFAQIDRVAGIIGKLQLRRPIYAPTAAEGHFGVSDRPWEQTDIADKLRELANV